MKHRFDGHPHDPPKNDSEPYAKERITEDGDVVLPKWQFL
jgi:hypothetical protein